MKVKDLLDIAIEEKAHVYYLDDNTEYVDVFKGFFREIPQEFIDKEVRGVFAKRKGLLDVWIYY